MVHIGNDFQKADVGVIGEKIAYIGHCPGAKASRIIDADGKYVLPGMIDFHTHIREPGVEDKEDYTLVPWRQPMAVLPASASCPTT